MRLATAHPHLGPFAFEMQMVLGSLALEPTRNSKLETPSASANLLLLIRFVVASLWSSIKSALATHSLGDKSRPLL